MKKNKGFSLVELIIVIAIMAILAAAIAPALIRYIDKSRKADDVTAAGTIATAANAALANEAAYESVQNSMHGTELIASAAGDGKTEFSVGSGLASGDNGTKFKEELNKNLTGNVAPKLKYKKTLDNATNVTPNTWYVYLSKDVPLVYVGNSGASGAPSSTNMVQLSPSIFEDYQ